MGKIKLLSPFIYNQIAAGEVIEKPCGAVKEVVENSIDAGATKIVIEVLNGGLDLISVTDNGCGMDEEDVELAFVKHATSKLSAAEEIYAMQTLGFRGEALSSIAAVSRVQLTTRRADADSAIKVTVEDGRLTDKQFVSANVGSRVEIRNIFFNIPARQKFLKAPSREGTDITKFVARLILTNSHIAVSYYLDGKLIYDTKGSGLEEAIFSVYGKGCLENCLPVSYSRNSTSVSGYIGSPEYTKANKNYQILSVNGRCVEDDRISAAVMQAFKPYLMTRKFPFFILDLKIPCDVVDVNVHPKKSEVRFANPSEVFSVFYHAAQDSLEEFVRSRAQDIMSSQRMREDEEKGREFFQESIDDVVARTLANEDLEVMTPHQTEDVVAIEDSTRVADRIQSLDDYAFHMQNEITVKKARERIGLENVSVNQTAAALELAETRTFEPMLSLSREEQNKADSLFERARILGSAFKTYLILELDDKIIFVDQHAAHERILFDKFLEGKSKDMQPVLFPYVFSVRDEEAEFIDGNRDNVLSAGIEIEPFGRNTYRIAAVSTLLADTKMSEFVDYLLESVDDFKLDDRKLIVEKIAKKACKAAVKAGYSLNEYEIKYILRQVCDNRILQCPHGRPITVVFTKNQFEKMFKRIV